MKALVYLFTLVSLIALVVIIINKNKVNEEDSYGCKLTAEKDECCWINNDGCCEPPRLSPGFYKLLQKKKMYYR